MLQSGHPDLLEAVVNQTIGMMEAKSKLAELVGRVAYGGQRYIAVVQTFAPGDLSHYLGAAA